MQDSYEELKGFSLVRLKRQPTFQPDPSMSGLGSGRARVMSVSSSDGWLGFAWFLRAPALVCR